jgi:hypothetical protein
MDLQVAAVEKIEPAHDGFATAFGAGAGWLGAGRHQGLNPKFEARNPKRIQSTKQECSIRA